MGTALLHLATQIWLLPFLSALAFAANWLWWRKQPAATAGLTLAVTTWSLLIALRALGATLAAPAGFGVSVPWVTAGRVAFKLGLAVDSLTAALLVVVAAVSWLVQIYSTAYLAGDAGFGRHYGYLALCAATIFGLLLSPNLFQMYVFYELLGLVSFLLVGSWCEEPGPAASRKAFLTNRLGDVGLLLGILVLYWHAGTLDFAALGRLTPRLDPHVLRLTAVLVLVGAAGKAAQIHLQTGLPETTAGPTLASGLVHALIMAVATVYLLARAYPLFAPAVAGPVPRLVAEGAGAVTAVLGAAAAAAQNDFRRVLAHVTLSQLGLAVLGLAAAGRSAAILHLIMYAFFTALLFLSAGAVLFRFRHQPDIWLMGGFRRGMPLTAVTFVIGALSLAGVPPLSGFYSRDAILLPLWDLAGRSAAYGILLAAALFVSLLTAFCVARLFFLVYMGEPAAHAPVAEAPWAMIIPLLVLAVPAAGLGYVGQAVLRKYVNWGLAGLTTALTLVGIGGAWLLYGRRRPAEDPLRAALGPVYELLHHGYYLDDLYAWLGSYLVRGPARACEWFERTIVDGIVDGVAQVIGLAGETLRRLQTGQVQQYILVMAATVFVALALWLLRGGGPSGLGGIYGW